MSLRKASPRVVAHDAPIRRSCPRKHPTTPRPASEIREEALETGIWHCPTRGCSVQLPYTEESLEDLRAAVETDDLTLITEAVARLKRDID